MSFGGISRRGEARRAKPVADDYRAHLPAMSHIAMQAGTCFLLGSILYECYD